MSQLHDAVEAGDLALVQQVLSLGSDPSEAGMNGLTPLHIAARDHRPWLDSPRLEVARALLAAGANPNATMATGSTPLHLAIRPSDDVADFVELLISHGADPSIKNNFGQTPLEDLRKLIQDLRAYGRPVSAPVRLIALLGGEDDSEAAREALAGSRIKDALAREVAAAGLACGSPEELRKGQEDFATWGGMTTGDLDAVLNAVSSKLVAVGVKSVQCEQVSDYEWQKSELQPFCVRVQGLRADGLLAGGYIGRLQEGRYGAFGFGLP